MKFPLRSQTAVFVAVVLCLGTRCAGYAIGLQQDNSPSAIPQSEPPVDQTVSSPAADTAVIPGPLTSFLRMAGISREISPDEVLPMLARNTYLYGYDHGKETEYLVLLYRYVQWARELQPLTDANGTIRITGCDDANRLIQVLGYKFEATCGQRNTALVTANAERAFLTIDSGFPLTALEQALDKNETFTYSFPTTRVPMFVNEKSWSTVTTWNKKSDQDLIDILMHDQTLDRLYAALSKCDPETRFALMQSLGLKKLVPLAAVFDAYGTSISIRSGTVIIPAGTEQDWEDLAGASPHSPGDFVAHLLAKDGGWLAAYFDVLSRLNQAQKAHLAEGTRLKRLYNAYRSTAPRAAATTGVFPRNPELLMLLTSLRWEANGDLEIPGGIGAWENILARKTKSKRFQDWVRRSHGWDNPERLLETLVASSNLQTDSGPVQIYLMLSAMDTGRPEGRRLSDETVQLLANRFSQFNRWFPIFAEFPALDNAAIAQFVRAADHMDGISNPALRANALGAFQADIGLWQIFARQGQIPVERLNSSWQGTVQPFIVTNSSVQLFEASRASLQAIMHAGIGKTDLFQDQIVDLLAGPSQNGRDSQRVHQEMAERIRSVLDDQRLVSLDTLFALYDGLTAMAHGEAVGTTLVSLAENLREFEMPRPIFTGTEKSSWSPVVYSSRHAELQVRTDLTKIIRSSASPSQLETARGQLTPFLRDTLVGLNYAYYEPPGAEVLHNNPLFVRSHDFSSISVQGVEQIWGIPELIGVGATAGGGAYLMGSLADLPYALASTEEDFIAPKNVQALIWKETVPQILVSAILPRWWAVNRNELHSAALYQRFGEELLIASKKNPDLRAEVTNILSDRMTPDRLMRTERAMELPDGATVLTSQTLPAESFYLAVEFRKKHPEQASKWGKAGRELEELSEKDPSDTSPARLSADFGVPHPTLNLTNQCTLLNMKPLSAFGGNASRLLAESWESNNLYWARLADEMGYPPVMLNVLVPTLTRHMITNIFASNIDDWPALLRALHKTGEEFRQGKITVQLAQLNAPQ